MTTLSVVVIDAIIVIPLGSNDVLLGNTSGEGGLLCCLCHLSISVLSAYVLVLYRTGDVSTSFFTNYHHIIRATPVLLMERSELCDILDAPLQRGESRITQKSTSFNKERQRRDDPDFSARVLLL
jgi:hypothetical protein